MTVEDNGRIPVDIMATENRSAAEVVMTVLHARGDGRNLDQVLAFAMRNRLPSPASP